ncbi:MAG: glycosyltransferase [Firmicutes bacterium]|jgi:glycosyltransferase involved in cell wall biosynthesis|nr:glycosyltransferase [Bacillota bacterium]
MENLVSTGIRTAIVTSYLPRQCGIATFSSDLLTSLKPNYNINHFNTSYLQVVAIENLTPAHEYPNEVTFIIREQILDDYIQAAGFINTRSIDVVSLQHEFNLFGGEDGNYITQFLNRLKKPVVTTLHTIPIEASPTQKKSLEDVCNLSTFIVVISEKSKWILREHYHIPDDRVIVIHHGVHDVPFANPAEYKKKINMEDRDIILTFGLLDQFKGMEYVIEAMKKVVIRHPQATFIILGKTHPAILKLHGEEYRESLKKMIKENKLDNNIFFRNEFVTLEELIDYLMAADIYITPYLNKERVSSGTLAYALACGKAIISTPYYYAQELLNDQRGRIVPFEDSEAIARELLLLLGDDDLRNEIRRKAYRFGRKMLWTEAGKSYYRTFAEAIKKEKSSN